jgi:hypothetical protein
MTVGETEHITHYVLLNELTLTGIYMTPILMLGQLGYKFLSTYGFILCDIILLEFNLFSFVILHWFTTFV